MSPCWRTGYLCGALVRKQECIYTTAHTACVQTKPVLLVFWDFAFQNLLRNRVCAPLRPSEMSMPETRGEHLRLWAVVRENGSLVSRLRTCGAFSLGSRCLMGRLPCAAMSCGRLDRDTSSAYQKARL